MILPNDARCREVLDALEDEPNLSVLESEFVESNHGRTVFTDKQREVIAKMLEKFEV